MLPKGSVKSTVPTDLGVKGHGGVLKSRLTAMGIGVVQGSNPDQMIKQSFSLRWVGRGSYLLPVFRRGTSMRLYT